MELVEGRSLDTSLAQERSKPPGTTSADTADLLDTGATGAPYYAAVADRFAQIADALDTAHQNDVVHRDVKPSNLVLDALGRLHLTDFGVARLTDDTPPLTATGDTVGTPTYMSPEQVRGEAGVDGRSDVYSLGATLYEVLTLEPPFDDANVGELYRGILARDPVPPSRLNPALPVDLETIVVKAMQKDPADRYATAGDMTDDLQAFAVGSAIAARRLPWPRRMWRWVRRHRVPVAAATIILLLGAGTLLVARDRERQAIARAQEAAARTRMQYDQLVLSAKQLIESEAPDEQTRAVLAEAIELDPDRYEAYVARGNLYENSSEETLGDLELARARGMPERSYRAARGLEFVERGASHRSQARVRTSRPAAVHHR